MREQAFHDVEFRRGITFVDGRKRGLGDHCLAGEAVIRPTPVVFLFVVSLVKGNFLN